MKYINISTIVSVVVAMVVFRYVVDKLFGGMLAKGSAYIPTL